jgi:hypothetical protein
MRTKNKNWIAGILMALLGVSCLFAFNFISKALAATNISATPAEHYAWNDLIGWMDFYNTLTINVSASGLTGYASSSVGDISLDCATTRIGNICGTSNYQVLNDGTGGLSGWGWNDAYGWISFCGGQSTAACPGSIATSSSYQVQVNQSTGEFTDSGVHRNYAWNDVIGWISFNCDNTGGCGTSNYKVVSSWTASAASGTLDSAIFDTGVSGGQVNSFTWYGYLPTGATVGVQFASAATSTGPWSYIGPNGTGGSYYVPLPGASLYTDFNPHTNMRYFRYRLTLTSNLAQTESPRIDDIKINWSR